VSQDKKSPWALVGEYTTLAMMMPASTVVGYLIGYGLDHLFHTHFLRVVFLLLGIAAGFIQLIRQVQKDAGE
jgi:F0F1-type ATP synthase assembly protein I